MTDKQQTLREAFERYYLGSDYGKKELMKALTRHHDGYYIYAAVQHDWMTWQAAARCIQGLECCTLEVVK